MLIRGMKAKDLPKVTRLYQAANVFAHRKDIRTWTSDGLRRYPTLNLVAEDAGEVIGAISATVPRQRLMRIEDISVSAAHRNTGVGGQLLKKVLGRAEKDGVHKIMLWVHWRNAQAITFLL